MTMAAAAARRRRAAPAGRDGRGAGPAARGAGHARRRRQAAPASPDARVTAARDAVRRAGQRLARAEDAQAAVMEKYHAAVAAGKAWAGKKPVPAGENVRIARIRKNLATARDRLAAAEARAAAAAPAKVSAADPDSRLLPAKNGGGYLQGWNLELAAARRQVLLAIELHDNPADCGALITMIEAAAANCELAGLREQIRAWLADNGYASAANFKALEHLMLLVAVTGEASQTGRGDAGGRTLPAGWEKMAARLATPAGKKLYKRRAALVEPAFAQLFARFGRYVNYRGRDAVDAEVKLLGAVHNLAKLLRLPAPAPGRRPCLTRRTPNPARRPGPAGTALQHARPDRSKPPGPRRHGCQATPPAGALPRRYDPHPPPPPGPRTGRPCPTRNSRVTASSVTCRRASSCELASGLPVLFVDGLAAQALAQAGVFSGVHVGAGMRDHSDCRPRAAAEICCSDGIACRRRFWCECGRR